MGLALGTAAIVLIVLVSELTRPRLAGALERTRQRIKARRAIVVRDFDPGRERRAELRAQALLRSCIDEHDWLMYRELGFLRVFGRQGAFAGVLRLPDLPAPADRRLPDRHR